MTFPSFLSTLPMPTPPAPSARRFLFQGIRPHLPLLFAQLLVALSWAFFRPLDAYASKLLVNALTISKGEPTPWLYRAVGYVMLTQVYWVISMRLHDLLWLRIKPGIKRSLGQLLIKRMLQHEHKLYQDHFAGALNGRMKDVIQKTPELCQLVIDRYISNSLSLLFSVLFLYRVSPRLALAMGLWLVAFFLVNALFYRKIGQAGRQAAQENTRLMGHWVDTIGNIMNVRFFANQAHEEELTDRHLDTLVHAERHRGLVMLSIQIIQGLFFLAYKGFCFYVLLKAYARGETTNGDFVMILQLNAVATIQLWMLSSSMGALLNTISDLRQALEVILLPIGIPDPQDALPLAAPRGQLTFKQVSFTYEDKTAGPPSLEIEQLTISPGERIGLVGYSGSGKSTFVNLILRLFELKKGTIEIDGQAIDQVTQASLRSHIGIVPQQAILFHRSVFDNIAYGRLSATPDQVRRAAQQAYASTFIEQLPQGYQTLVGERGIKLSGGQRQRIALARAILKNPRIFILDEATSQLDTLTEGYIQRCLEHYMQGRTTIAIAHRLSTLLAMSRILVFDQGRIIAQGTHHELLTQEGLYAQLWHAQVDGFLPTKSAQKQEAKTEQILSGMP